MIVNGLYLRYRPAFLLCARARWRPGVSGALPVRWASSWLSWQCCWSTYLGTTWGPWSPTLTCYRGKVTWHDHVKIFSALLALSVGPLGGFHGSAVYKWQVMQNFNVLCVSTSCWKSWRAVGDLICHDALVMSLCKYLSILHDDAIKWKHFPHNCLFVRGIHRSPVNSLNKGQWRGALMFSLICAWINC